MLKPEEAAAIANVGTRTIYGVEHMDQLAG
jgi:hypothetical protein